MEKFFFGIGNPYENNPILFIEILKRELKTDEDRNKQAPFGDAIVKKDRKGRGKSPDMCIIYLEKPLNEKA